MSMNAKITYLDIETSPIVAHVWGLRDQNIGINQIIEDPRCLGYGYKINNGAVKWASEWDPTGRRGMLEAAHSLLDEADVVVHYNGNGFDIPWLNGELAKEGFTPPAPFKNIDLYRVVRKNYRLPSYKLQYVCQTFGLGGKIDTGGHKLWVDCLAGDEKAQAKMGKYCRQDVRLLPLLLDKVRPHLAGTVNMALLNGIEGLACTKCGSVDLQSRGTVPTTTRVYRRYRCNACGGWTRDTRSIGSTKSAGIPR